MGKLNEKNVKIDSSQFTREVGSPVQKTIPEKCKAADT